jgi:hypothetical protein
LNQNRQRQQRRHRHYRNSGKFGQPTLHGQV